MRTTREAARNKWRGVLMEFGVDGQYLRNVHGPCPLCDGKDRFRWDNKDGAGTYYCSHCGPGDGMQLLLQYTGLEFKELARKVDRIVGNIQADRESPRPSADATARLRRIAQGLRPLDGRDPASVYLASRGLREAEHSCLRYHPAMPYFHAGEKLGAFPAMIAAMRWPDTRLETMHCTYLRPDGSGKADVPSPKKLLGKRSETIAGCSIPLTDGPVPETLGIAEGIETALSIQLLHGMACWSVFSAAGMEAFVPPPGVRRVVIYPDSDGHYVGQASAMILARNLVKRGYLVGVADFLPIDSDYNDILRGLK